MNNLEEILYLSPLELSGPEQMAIDLFLLEKSFDDEDFNMAIRFLYMGWRLVINWETSKRAAKNMA